MCAIVRYALYVAIRDDILDLFPSLIEPDERDADGEPLLPRVGHGLAHRHHHLARLRPVGLPVLLQEPAQGILLVRQICWKLKKEGTGCSFCSEN